MVNPAQNKAKPVNKKTTKAPDKNALNKEEDNEYQNYEEKEEIEWILDLPDTCIGSTEIAEDDDTDYFVYREDKIEKGKKIKFIPGLYKIFDECAVNAADNGVRTMNMKGADKSTYIKFEIYKDRFSVTNDGKPVPVMMHKEKKVWVPEMVFGHLRTSGNYKKGEKRIVGGKNGLGAKLALIFSTKTVISIVDNKRKKSYMQVFSNNMREKSEPKIEDTTDSNMVRIECYPDFPRFDDSTEFSDDMMDYLKRRVYDIAASSNEGMKVYLNDEQVTITNFKDYVKMYEPDATEDDIIYAKPHNRWEIAVVKTDHSFQQVSFVNNIHTYKGGKHVSYVMGMIESHLFGIIKKKQPNAKKTYIKNYTHIYINCFIDNPSFDSQTKGQMTSNTTKFGSSFKLDKEFQKKLEKCGIVENVIQFSDFKVNQGAKKVDGKKTMRLSDIPKLEDAMFAGKGDKAKLCTLILTEGDSAMSLALSGLSIEQRKYFGVFPLRGKLLNVRDASTTVVLNNKEINDIKKILGLKQNQVVDDISVLRYGRVCLMTDAVVDGFHIKGLLMNLFMVLWESTFKIDHFLGCIRTPILKATLGGVKRSFYTTPSFDKWSSKLTDADKKRVKIKYYKGLGTSTDKEAQEYFSNLDKNMVFYTSEELSESIEHLDMVFNKNYADKRKDWLGEYDMNCEISYNKKNETSVKSFIDNELIHFSNYDNIRSIPSVVDGLKVSQRKILYGAFLKKIKEEIKVAQLAGYISEHTGYHHGEVSLHGTITKMAQTFVGSNNINYFEPCGQFGTRLKGGDDAAAPRYIFTKLISFIYKIFRNDDFAVLKHSMSDNEITEPVFYCPVIPMLLVNGSVGIGTGYSTDITTYNPIDIIKNIKHKIRGESYKDMLPYFDGFGGKIKAVKKDGSPVSYLTSGLYEIKGDDIHITEIPIGVWTLNYKAYIDSLVIDNSAVKAKNEKEKKKAEALKKKQFIKSYDSVCTQYTINIVIHADPYAITQHVMNGDLVKILKLESKISTSNMVAYNADNKLTKYDTVNDIMDDFYKTRHALYGTRIKHQLGEIEKRTIVINEKIRFILDIIDNKIVVFKKSKDDIHKQLEAGGFKLVDDSYQHLLSMSIYSFTKEKIEEMQKTKAEIDQHKHYLETTSIEDQWEKELDELEAEYTKARTKKHKFIEKCIKGKCK